MPLMAAVVCKTCAFTVDVGADGETVWHSRVWIAGACMDSWREGELFPHHVPTLQQIVGIAAVKQI